MSEWEHVQGEVAFQRGRLSHRALPGAPGSTSTLGRRGPGSSTHGGRPGQRPQTTGRLGSGLGRVRQRQPDGQGSFPAEASAPNISLPRAPYDCRRDWGVLGGYEGWGLPAGRGSLQHLLLTHPHPCVEPGCKHSQNGGAAGQGRVVFRSPHPCLYPSSPLQAQTSSADPRLEGRRADVSQP